MGNQEVTYQILRYPGALIPSNYINFIRSKWARSYRYGNDYIKLIDSDAYFDAYSRYIGRLLMSTRSVIRIATLSEDPDVALGFSVVSGTILHYVFVTKDFRRLGIGKLLVPVKIERFTHITKIGLTLWPTKLGEAIFDPFAL